MCLRHVGILVQRISSKDFYKEQHIVVTLQVEPRLKYIDFLKYLHFSAKGYI